MLPICRNYRTYLFRGIFVELTEITIKKIKIILMKISQRRKGIASGFHWLVMKFLGSVKSQIRFNVVGKIYPCTSTSNSTFSNFKHEGRLFVKEKSSG